MRRNSATRSVPAAYTLGPRGRRTVTVDDVVVALAGLFAQLNAKTQFTLRIKAPDRRSRVHRPYYLHTATIGEVLRAWHQNPQYLDDKGNPLPIKLRGGRRSFVALAGKAAPAIDPVALLAELKHIGAVSIDRAKTIQVKMRSLPVYRDRELAIHYTLTCLRNYILTLSHNLESGPTNSDQLFHRTAWNHSLSQEHIPALKIKLRRQGQAFLESFDNWMTRRIKSDGSKTRRARRAQVSIGVYLAINDARPRKAKAG